MRRYVYQVRHLSVMGGGVKHYVRLIKMFEPTAKERSYLDARE